MVEGGCGRRMDCVGLKIAESFRSGTFIEDPLTPHIVTLSLSSPIRCSLFSLHHYEPLSIRDLDGLRSISHLAFSI